MEEHNCPGYTDRDVSCWLGRGHGDLTLIKALAHSCNFYFYTFLKDRLDKESYVRTLRDLNIYYSDRDFLSGGDIFYQEAFGLGAHYAARPLSVLYAYSALFNGGKVFNEKGKLVNRLRLDEELVDIIRQGMKESYLYGTAANIFENTGLVDMIAKTGTGPDQAHGDFVWNDNIGWVIVMTPSINPTFALLVIIKNSKSSVAVQIASRVLNELKEK